MSILSFATLSDRSASKTEQCPTCKQTSVKTDGYGTGEGQRPLKPEDLARNKLIAQVASEIKNSDGALEKTKPVAVAPSVATTGTVVTVEKPKATPVAVPATEKIEAKPSSGQLLSAQAARLNDEMISAREAKNSWIQQLEHKVAGTPTQATAGADDQAEAPGMMYYIPRKHDEELFGRLAYVPSFWQKWMGKQIKLDDIVGDLKAEVNNEDRLTRSEKDALLRTIDRKFDDVDDDDDDWEEVFEAATDVIDAIDAKVRRKKLGEKTITDITRELVDAITNEDSLYTREKDRLLRELQQIHDEATIPGGTDGARLMDYGLDIDVVAALVGEASSNGKPAVFMNRYGQTTTNAQDRYSKSIFSYLRDRLGRYDHDYVAKLANLFTDNNGNLDTEGMAEYAHRAYRVRSSDQRNYIDQTVANGGTGWDVIEMMAERYDRPTGRTRPTAQATVAAPDPNPLANTTGASIIEYGDRDDLLDDLLDIVEEIEDARKDRMGEKMKTEIISELIVDIKGNALLTDQDKKSLLYEVERSFRRVDRMDREDFFEEVADIAKAVDRVKRSRTGDKLKVEILDDLIAEINGESAFSDDDREKLIEKAYRKVSRADSWDREEILEDASDVITDIYRTKRRRLGQNLKTELIGSLVAEIEADAMLGQADKDYLVAYAKQTVKRAGSFHRQEIIDAAGKVIAKVDKTKRKRVGEKLKADIFAQLTLEINSDDVLSDRDKAYLLRNVKSRLKYVDRSNRTDILSDLERTIQNIEQYRQKRLFQKTKRSASDTLAEVINGNTTLSKSRKEDLTERIYDWMDDAEGTDLQTMLSDMSRIVEHRLGRRRISDGLKSDLLAGMERFVAQYQPPPVQPQPVTAESVPMPEPATVATNVEANVAAAVATADQTDGAPPSVNTAAPVETTEVPGPVKAPISEQPVVSAPVVTGQDTSVEESAPGVTFVGPDVQPPQNTVVRTEIPETQTAVVKENSDEPVHPVPVVAAQGDNAENESPGPATTVAEVAAQSVTGTVGQADSSETQNSKVVPAAQQPPVQAPAAIVEAQRTTRADSPATVAETEPQFPANAVADSAAAPASKTPGPVVAQASIDESQPMETRQVAQPATPLNGPNEQLPAKGRDSVAKQDSDASPASQVMTATKVVELPRPDQGPQKRTSRSVTATARAMSSVGQSQADSGFMDVRQYISAKFQEHRSSSENGVSIIRTQERSVSTRMQGMLPEEFGFGGKHKSDWITQKVNSLLKGIGAEVRKEDKLADKKIESLSLKITEKVNNAVPTEKEEILDDIGSVIAKEVKRKKLEAKIEDTTLEDTADLLHKMELQFKEDVEGEVLANSVLYFDRSIKNRNRRNKIETEILERERSAKDVEKKEIMKQVLARLLDKKV